MSELDDLLDPEVNKTNNNNNINYTGHQKTIPNANGVLVLGIISIVGCVLFGIAGLVCGIIALILFKKTKDTYLSDPKSYETSFKNAKAGFVCAIIGTILSGLCFLYWLFAFIMMATVASSVNSYSRF